MNNIINFLEEKKARLTLEERRELLEIDVMAYIHGLITEDKCDVVIIKDDVMRDENDELSEENILFIDAEREDYDDLLWGMFVENDKTIFSATFANDYYDSWMCVVYADGEMLTIEKW